MTWVITSHLVRDVENLTRKNDVKNVLKPEVVINRQKLIVFFYFIVF